MKATRVDGRFGTLERALFDVTSFLAQPLVARLATAGPVLRPVWFLWEDEIFWVLTGGWSRLARRLDADPVFELAVDTCDLITGQMRQVIATGTGSVVAFDTERGRRKLTRYLGPDEASWDKRFSLHGDPNARGIRWARLVPERLLILDQSYRPASDRRAGTSSMLAVP